MKTRFLISFTLFFIFSNVSAQYIYYLEKKKDQTNKLTEAIENESVDSIKAIKSFEISANYISKQDLENYHKYLEQGKQLSKNSKVISDIGRYYESLENFTKSNALELLEADFNRILPVLEKYDQIEAKKIRVIMFQNLSNFSLMKGNEKESMKYLLNKAIPLAKSISNTEFLSALYKDVAIRFYNSKNYTKTLKYAQLSVKMLEGLYNKKSNSYSYLCEAYMLKAEVYTKLGKQENAIVEIIKTDKILKQFPDNNFTPYYYNVLGEYHRKNKNYREALQYFDKGIDEAEKFNNEIILNRLKIFKQNVYTEIGEFEKSNNLLREIEKNSKIPNDKKEILKGFSKNFIGLKDTTNALLYAKKYVESFDSINDVKKNKDIALLEAKYNQAINERKLLLIENQKNRALQKVKNNQLYTYASLLASLFLIAIIIFLWKYLKTQKLLNEEVEKNYKQNISTLKTQKEIEVMQAMIDGEEIERKRIARELHDGIGSKLSALKILMLRIDSQQISNENLTRFNELLSTSITELRQVSYNLVPESLLKLGLENALGDLCHLLHSEKVKIEFQAFDITNTIPVSSQINIYRIVQELINNALKHSGCSEILVSCSQNGNTFFISVEDNGNGFDISSIDDKTGLGIKNLKSRVELLSGTYNVESNKSGTYYNIELKI